MPSDTEDQPLSVLVVDDYPAMVKMTCEMLRLCGYEALGYTDPRQAVEDFPSLPNVGLAMTDQSMPELDGIEVARALLTHRPDLPIVLMSAVGDDHLSPVFQAAGFCAVLPKPYTLQRLRECVAQILTPDNQPQPE